MQNSTRTQQCNTLTQKGPKAEERYSFNNDYSEGAHPRILQNLIAVNEEQSAGYGLDDHCRRAGQMIKEAARCDDIDVHFVPGGTQANLIAIAAALRPWQAVISTNYGHISVHESGAIEATGHKVIAMPSRDGKLRPRDVLDALQDHNSEHMVQPKMIYISNPTELGTQYTKAELQALFKLSQEKQLFLFLDGARLGSALASPVNDMTLADIAALTDGFYIGGTKNGALFGEALIMRNPALKPHLRFLIKQRGALLAKGWLLAMQFEVLLANDLWLQLAAHANAMAMLLRRGFEECGYSLMADSVTNQMFVVLPPQVSEQLAKHFLFSEQERLGDDVVVRFVTSWATKEAQCRRLVEVLKDIKK